MVDLTVFKIFTNQDPFLRVFSTSNKADFTIFFTIFMKCDALLRIFLTKMGPILVKKITHLGGTILYALTCENPYHIFKLLVVFQMFFSL